MTIAPHLFPELNVQLLASIPNGLWIEDMGLSDDLWIEPVPVMNGTITAPERPGHGLAFRPEILRDSRSRTERPASVNQRFLTTSIGITVGCRLLPRARSVKSGYP